MARERDRYSNRDRRSNESSGRDREDDRDRRQNRDRYPASDRDRDRNYDRGKNRKRKPKRSGIFRRVFLPFFLIVVLVAALAAAGYAVYWCAQQLLQPSTGELPTIIGVQPEVAETIQPQLETGAVDLIEAEYTVVIDPGHGGGDGGTEGYIIEKEMTHAVSAILYDLLLEDGRFTPILTHSLDMADDEYMSQGERVEVAQSVSADLFLSIHGNSYTDESVRGTECFAIPPERDSHEESVAFATLIAAGFEAEGATLRGETGVRYAYFKGATMYYADASDTSYNSHPTYEVLEGVDYPAVLVEQWYVSSTEDLELFGGADGYDLSAQVYYQAICDYFYP